MKKFVVERNLPGAGHLTGKELQAMAKLSCQVLGNMEQPYHWIQSFITEDKIYCIHIAESEACVREHARLAMFPVNTITEVITVIDPLTAEELPQRSGGTS